MKHKPGLARPYSTEKRKPREAIGRLKRNLDDSLEWSYRSEMSPLDFKVRSCWRGASPFFIVTIKQVAARLLAVDNFEGKRFMRYFGAYRLSDLDNLSDMHIMSVTECAESAFPSIPEALRVKIGISELAAA